MADRDSAQPAEREATCRFCGHGDSQHDKQGKCLCGCSHFWAQDERVVELEGLLAGERARAEQAERKAYERQLSVEHFQRELDRQRRDLIREGDEARRELAEARAERDGWKAAYDEACEEVGEAREKLAAAESRCREQGEAIQEIATELALSRAEANELGSVCRDLREALERIVEQESCGHPHGSLPEICSCCIARAALTASSEKPDAAR